MRAAIVLLAVVMLVSAACAPAATLSPSPSPTETPTPKPTETPTPEPTPTPKPLPEVINKQTVEFVTLPPQEIQKMIEEAKEKGELKLPLPEIVSYPGISLVRIHNNRGESGFAITASSREGTFVLPALAKGKTYVSAKGAPSFVGIMDSTSGEALVGYILPSTIGGQVNVLVNANEDISVGQPLVRLAYAPDGDAWKEFAKMNQVNFRDVPQNTIAIIGGRTGTSLAWENILTTLQGAAIAVGPSGKEPGK